MRDKKNKLNQILQSRRNHVRVNNAVCFLSGDRMPYRTSGKGLLPKIQDTIKQNGRLYYMLVDIFAPVLMNTKYKAKLKSLLQKYDHDSVILNLGSGPQFICNRKDIINLDAFAFNEVDIVADAHDLPILDNTVDLILNISLLEHVPQPEKVVEEMYRILKPGGEIIACLPFMMPFHAAPFDHYRWTQPGIKELFSLYQIYEIDIAYGPTSGLLWVLQEWLAIILSFGFKTLHDIAFLTLMVVMSPIKLLDKLLNKYPFAEKIASGFYINAQK